MRKEQQFQRVSGVPAECIKDRPLRVHQWDVEQWWEIPGGNTGPMARVNSRGLIQGKEIAQKNCEARRYMTSAKIEGFGHTPTCGEPRRCAVNSLRYLKKKASTPSTGLSSLRCSTAVTSCEWYCYDQSVPRGFRRARDISWPTRGKIPNVDWRATRIQRGNDSLELLFLDFHATVERTL